MSNNELNEIITVGDLIDYLKQFPVDAIILKSDMLSAGYNRFRITPTGALPVCVNPQGDVFSDIEYIDADRAPGCDIVKAVVL